MNFWVYGTLLRGMGNHKLIASLIDASLTRRAVVKGVKIVHFVDGGFPGIFKGDGSVVGELMIPLPGKEAEMMLVLDELEEYYPDDPTKKSMYQRCTVQTHCPEDHTAPVDAWAYYCVAVGWMEEYRGVIIEPAGDEPVSWKNFVMKHELPTAGGDWADGKYVEQF